MLPESYEGGTCRYQLRAQPYLASIAQAVRNDATARAFLLLGTAQAARFADSEPLWQRQWFARDPQDAMKCPFWSNYWSEPCSSCNCRVDGSVSMEIDALFFLRNPADEVLALHVEVKRRNEAFSIGQAEAYRLRAECYRDGRRARKGVLKHQHFATLLFCDDATDLDEAARHFDRIITHEMAWPILRGYPDT